jgi:hypothetical protein
MRVGRYLVTTIDYVGPEGVEQRLTIQPSESLPEERRMKIRQGEIQELLRVIKRMEEN